jgi:hypothetical protein
LNDSIDGHSTIRAGLGRGVDHGTGILIQKLTVDSDGAAVSLRRGAENLTVVQRRFIRVYGDTTPNCLGATGD